MTPTQSQGEKRTAIFTLITLASLFIFPFLQPQHDLPLTSMYSEWLAFLLGLTAIAATTLSPSFAKNNSIPAGVWLLLALALFALLHTAFSASLYPQNALAFALYIVWAAGVAVASAALKNHCPEHSIATTIAWFALVAGVLHALVPFLSYFDPNGMFRYLIATQTQGNAFGNIAQRNHYTDHLALSFAALLYLTGTRRISVGITVPFGLLLLAAMTLTASRTVWLYLVGFIALSGYFYATTRTKESRTFLIAATVALAVFALMQWFAPWLFRDLRFQATTALERMEGLEGGFDIRTIEWIKAWKTFLHAPLLGVGIGNYTHYSYLYHDPSLWASRTGGELLLLEHAHNLFLQILAEMGIVGFVPLVLLVVGMTINYLHSPKTPALWLFGALLLVLFIHSNVEHPLWFAYFLGLAAFLLGQIDRPFHSTPPVVLRGVRAMLGITTVGGFALLAWTLSSYVPLARMAADDTYIKDTVDRPIYARQLLAASINPFLTAHAEFMMANILPLNSNHIEQKVEFNTRVFYWRPLAPVVYRQVVLLALDKRYREADAILRQAVRRYPRELPSFVATLKDMDEPRLAPLRRDALALSVALEWVPAP